MKNSKINRIMLAALLTLIVLIVIGLSIASYYNLIPKKTYTSEYFGIKFENSEIDFNNNGIDDYSDILEGAKTDAKNKPKYDPAYWPEGFPPDDVGVCTDVVWRAFKNAGYNLREMVDKDIQDFPEAYPAVQERDKNIDFRRVRNLHVFFEKYAITLTTDISKIDKWQAGDIVIFGEDKHIGIVSDKRNKYGTPYIIHNGGQPVREEDYLQKGKVTAHFRFDASKIDENYLIGWAE